MFGLLGGIASGVMNLFGQSSAEKRAEKSDKRNIALQKQFAQEGIQWKAADAIKAGIHPLYAMGANTMSFSPVTAGASVPQKDFSFLSDMGQSIDRARQVTSPPATRGASRVLEALTLERHSLENEKLRSEIRRSNMSTPPFPALVPEEVVLPQRTTGVNIGAGFRSAPAFSDAQTYEDRYGELGGSALGLANIPADFLYNAYNYLTGGRGPQSRNYSRPNPVRR